MRAYGIYMLFCMIIHSAISVSEDSKHYSVLFQNQKDDINSDKLLIHGNRAFVGGTNYFLEVTFTSEGKADDTKRVSFKSSPSNYQICRHLSPDDHCENSVRVMEVMNDASVLLCGTNAKGPKCSYYNTTSSTFKDADLDAKTWLTKSPTGSTTSLYTGHNSSDSSLYLGSVQTNSKTGVFCKKIPTSLKSNKNWLDAPEFMGTYSLGKKRDKVYVFFNEKSTKFIEGDFAANNRKNDYYGMVARVCENDNGGSWKGDMWMTFTKARLLCPWPGNDLQSMANLFYNELVATYPTEESVFGIFRTRRNWNLTTYAVCKFGADDVDATLEGKLFDSNRTEYFDAMERNNVMSFTDNDVPFLPGQCPASSSYVLKSNFEQFVLENTLVKMNVLPKGKKAFYVTTNEEAFKFILVQTFPWCTAIYLLTETGTMTKLTVDGDMQPRTLFSKKLASADLGITAAQLMEKHGFILASTKARVITIPLQFCSAYKECNSCNIDPHCRWQEIETSPFFECKVAETPELRACLRAPDKPQNLSATVTEKALELIWMRHDVGFDVLNVVSITCIKENKVIFSTKINKNEITVSREILEDGSAYLVEVRSLNKTSLSAISSVEFNLPLQKPRLSHTVGLGGVIELRWSSVVGAESYLMNLLNSNKKLLQEFVFTAKQGRLYFYLSNLTPTNRYTVTVTALSRDNVKSKGEIDFTGPGKETGPLELSRPGTTSCGGFISALVVFVLLFLGSLFIILHNNFTIKPNVNVLRNDDGCSYKRRHLLIWRKENRKQSHHMNCNDTVVSSTSS